MPEAGSLEGPRIDNESPLRGQHLTVGWCSNAHMAALYVGQTHSTEFMLKTATKTPARRTVRCWPGAYGLIPGQLARRMEVCFVRNFD